MSASVTFPNGNSAINKYSAELVSTARALVAPGKGILAADESTGTIGKRVRCSSDRDRSKERDFVITKPSPQFLSIDAGTSVAWNLFVVL
jgi:hypothetical protein